MHLAGRSFTHSPCCLLLRYRALGFTIAPETNRLLCLWLKQVSLQLSLQSVVWLKCEKSLSDGAFSDFLNVFFAIGGLSVISAELEKQWNEPIYKTLKARFNYANNHQLHDTALLYSAK